MAYVEHTIVSMSEIPALIGSFADANGWSVDDTDPNAPIIRRADDIDAVEFRFYQANDGSGTSTIQRLVVHSPNYSPEMRCDALSPRLGPSLTGNVPTIPNPTKVHLMSMLEPEPWIAVTVEYGFNSYRHLYLGYMEKLGNYTGGEVLASCEFVPHSSTSSTSSRPNYIGGSGTNTGNKYLFNWNNSSLVDEGAGGVRIVHADNPNTFRLFRRGSNNQNIGTSNPYINDVAMGGFLDGLNDGYITYGNNNYAGASLLVPVNLYAPVNGTHLRPIGRPAGVRYVNISNLEPGVQIDIGDDRYIVFPMFRKTNYTDAVPQVSPAGGTWYRNSEESSYYIGIAFHIDDGAP